MSKKENDWKQEALSLMEGLVGNLFLIVCRILYLGPGF